MHFLILFESFKVAVINVVAIIMMSAIQATLGLLKKRVF